jgi:ATP-dependent DNA helicase PIF1
LAPLEKQLRIGSNIGGCTLHSWAGIGLGRQPAQQLYEGVMRNEPTKRRWRETGALVIDEGGSP